MVWTNNVDFELIWKRSFANPLFAIEFMDLTNDGLKELTVASLSGLHVLQVSNLLSIKLPFDNLNAGLADVHDE